MNRLEKKCFIVSTGFHLLLALILLVGPAFVSSDQQKLAPAQYIDIIPANIVEGAFAGGGNPNAKPPAPTPPRQELAAPKPPEPVKAQPQKKEVASEPKSAPEPSAEPSETKKRGPQIDPKNLVTRKSDSKSKSTKSKEASEAQKWAKARADQAAQVQSALENLKEGLSSSTTIEIQGPGGEAYAGYLSVLTSIYQRCYDRELAMAGELAGKESTVIVTVTVERSGKVVNSRLSNPSGIAQLDRLVRRVLEQVDFIRPFPPGSKDSERTFTIGFELRLNKAIG